MNAVRNAIHGLLGSRAAGALCRRLLRGAVRELGGASELEQLVVAVELVL